MIWTTPLCSSLPAVPPWTWAILKETKAYLSVNTVVLGQLLAQRLLSGWVCSYSMLGEGRLQAWGMVCVQLKTQQLLISGIFHLMFRAVVDCKELKNGVQSKR